MVSISAITTKTANWLHVLRSEYTRNRIREITETTIYLFKGERMAQVGFILILAFVLMAILAPVLAPYDPGETNRDEGGQLLRTEPPSEEHVLGTNNRGQDVLSQVIYGAQTSVIVGFAAAFIAVLIGANVALVGAYYGGWFDDILQRVVDLAYGLPFLPFVLVLVFIFDQGLHWMIVAIAAVLWRDSARVIRSEVLSQKQRPFVESARAVGASNPRIMYRHILPNVLPIVMIYMAFAVAYAVIMEASVAFLGFSDPDMFSWGQMMFEAYIRGGIRRAWWWVLPPGICIMLLVMAVFFIGRSLEKITNPELRH